MSLLKEIIKEDVDEVANHNLDEILEGLAIHCLEYNLKLSDIIKDLKIIYNRSARGAEEYKKDTEK